MKAMDERGEANSESAFERTVAKAGRALAVCVVAGSSLAACSTASSDLGAAGASGATSSAAGGAPGSVSDSGGAGSNATAPGGSGLGGGDVGNVAGSSSAGAPTDGTAGAPEGGSTAASSTGGAGGVGTGGAAAGSGGTSSKGGAGGGSATQAGCPTGATFCDNFDASANLAAAWTMDNTLGATIKVVNAFTSTPGPTAAHSGSNAVQIGFTTGAGYAMIVSKMGFPAPPAAAGYWARAWLYVETPASDAGHTVYIEGSTGMDLKNAGARPLNMQGGKMEINIDPVNGGEASAAAATAIPRGAWTCFEWQISATGGTGDVALYVAGVMMPTASLKAKPIQALVEQRIGYERYAAGAAGNLWIDDYAIGSARLGCM